MTTQTKMATPFSLEMIARSKDAALAVLMLLILLMIIVPLPALVIDMLIAFNLALSISILLTAMYISRPLDFSAFPTILLMATLFRLGINIAVSRSILLEAQAGKVIETFGSLVVGGNYVVGVVVFLMLMIIQFVVITNGTGRVAEVAARFTLDAMPGKQLSIDADLNSGLIDEDDARRRRKDIAAEADFYGAMDGSVKFVKGDATAGLIIVAVNIIGGFVIGALMYDMTVMESLQQYTLLTVGSGLVVQISALLVSTAAGLIVTRSTADSSLGSDVIGQLSNVQALGLVSAMLMAVALVPGMPKVPFIGLALILAGATYAAWQATKREEELPVVEEARPEGPEDMYGMLMVDPVELEIGYGLIPLVSEDRSDNLLRRITSIRRQIAGELGMVLPIVRVRDNLRLSPNEYLVKIRGEEVARGELMLERQLAIPGSQADGQLSGVRTREPAFGLPALWITDTDKARAEMMGYTVVDPVSVLSTHLTEIVREQAPELLGRQEVQEMIDRVRRERPAAVEGLVPEQLSLGRVQAVLRNLLKERVPIRDLAGILEILANNAGITQDPGILSEAVRQRMARTLSNQYRDDTKTLNVFTLSPVVELHLKQALVSSEDGLALQLDPSVARAVLSAIGEKMEQMAHTGNMPILLTSREIRRALRLLVERSLPGLTILAFSEVSQGTKVQAHGMVELAEETRES
ncbi:MAG: flagellar biosynthesis protein FlhA [Anaerolineales bacterium]|nr:flagellar biosynthesis protein FlhA [Anaerolineales bacterium]